MSSPPWQDRRGMFQPGKHVHEPAKPKKAVEKVVTADKAPTTSKATASPTGTSPTASTASPTEGVGSFGRRRSSASSQNGLFGSLLANRSSVDYTQRRQSWDDMKKSDGLAGFFGGLVDKSKK